MRSKKYDEDASVKLPAIIQFMRLGYDFQELSDHVDFNTKIFVRSLKQSVEKINGRKFSDDEIDYLLTDIHKSISNNDLGKDFYHWLINPIDRIKLIDFEHVENNKFAVVDELPFTVAKDTQEKSFRPDITVLINGMPLAFLEVKKPNNTGGIQEEFTRMINNRLKNPLYRKFFNMIQIITFSNNMDYENDDSVDLSNVKAGSFYTTPNGFQTTFSFFREDIPDYHQKHDYQFIDSEDINYVFKTCGYDPINSETAEFNTDNSPFTPCNMFITSVFDKERLLYFIQYGLMYVSSGTKKSKQIMRYPQFFASRNVIKRLDSNSNRMICWHTQGAGKTNLAGFLIRILSDYYANQGINARFFFIVDRLELLNQAVSEFTNHGFSVTIVNSRTEFSKEVSKPIPINISSTTGEICVTNIQKFEENIPSAKNDYNANVKRVFFVDEAHRSYKMAGVYLKNLFTVDVDAVYIALTGTPLLTTKERSNLKFGDYVHKYFYDKSIADGYTLRLKRETIDKTAREEIKQNIELEIDELDDDAVYNSQAFVDNVSKFIKNDFSNFRFINDDNSVGGMIVCHSNKQAQMIHEWFENNCQNLKTGLVINASDATHRKINKETQINFKENGFPDIIVVNRMLTVGFDAPRLKKEYLLRGPKDQALLQTVSRVNRPYKAPNGRLYKYGYIVDFVDIKKEYDRTLAQYIKELETDLNQNEEEAYTLDGIVVDAKYVEEKYQSYLIKLTNIVPIDNLSAFTVKINQFNKETIYLIRRYLNELRSCETELALSHDFAFLETIDSAQQLLRLVQERIDYMNLAEDPVSVMKLLDNEDIVKIVYKFAKQRGEILGVENFENSEIIKSLYTRIRDIGEEVNKNRGDNIVQSRAISELLHELFDKLSISDEKDIQALDESAKAAIKTAKKINDEFEEISKTFGGSYGYVNTYIEMCEQNPNINKKTILKFMKIIYRYLGGSNKQICIQSRQRFVNSVKKGITGDLMKKSIYLDIRPIYDETLRNLYKNVQIYG